MFSPLLLSPDSSDGGGTLPTPEIPRDLLRLARELRSIWMEPENFRSRQDQPFLRVISELNSEISKFGMSVSGSGPQAAEATSTLLALRQYHLAERSFALLSTVVGTLPKEDGVPIMKMQRQLMFLALEMFIRHAESSEPV